MTGWTRSGNWSTPSAAARPAVPERRPLTNPGPREGTARTAAGGPSARPPPSRAGSGRGRTRDRGSARLGLPLVPDLPGRRRPARGAAGGDRGSRRRPHHGRDRAPVLRRGTVGAGRPGGPRRGRADAGRGAASGRAADRDHVTGTAGLSALGIDIGGTKGAGGGVAADGSIVATARRATPGASVSDTEDAIVAVVEELADGHDGELVGVGVGAAGWFDRTGDTVLFSPHLAWRHSTLRKDLAARLQRPLWVGNDADPAAWAEYRYGAARGSDLALMITLGTGIGGGIVLDGRLRRGSHGVAGEWGHMRVVPDGRLCACGNRGCWEQYASGTALGQTAREVARTSPAAAERLLERVEGQADRLTGEHVARAAAEGDPLALELVTEVGLWLGQGIADLAAVLDPEVVVIGGGVSKLGEMVLAPARERLERALPGRGFRPGPRVVVAELGPQAGMVGAADLVRRSVADGEA